MKPRAITVSAVEHIGCAIEEVLDLERRGTEYCVERHILNQANIVRKARAKELGRDATAEAIGNDG